MEFGEKLRNQLLNANVSQSELSRRLGVSRSAVSKWISNSTTPDVTVADSIAKALNISIEDLLSDSWVGEMRHVGGDKAYIPVIGEIACGAPILATQNVERYKEVLKDGLPDGELFYLVARGDSMEPRIFDGDDVLIRVQPDVEDGEIAAVQVDNDNRATLKKVQHVGDNVVLTPLNTDYQTIILNEENPGRIIGKAIRIEGTL